MFEKLKKWKRIATRYDRFAVKFLAAIALVALSLKGSMSPLFKMGAFSNTGVVQPAASNS